MLWIFWVLAVPARKSASHLGTDFHRTYTSSALMLCVLWLVYPVIWAVCDGGNVITPTSEMVACESSGAFLEVLGTSGAAKMALERSRSLPAFLPSPPPRPILTVFPFLLLPYRRRRCPRPPRQARLLVHPRDAAVAP